MESAGAVPPDNWPLMLRLELSDEKSRRSLTEPPARKPEIVSWPLAVLRESLAAAKTNESARR